MDVPIQIYVNVCRFTSSLKKRLCTLAKITIIFSLSHKMTTSELLIHVAACTLNKGHLNYRMNNHLYFI